MVECECTASLHFMYEKFRNVIIDNFQFLSCLHDSSIKRYGCVCVWAVCCRKFRIFFPELILHIECDRFLFFSKKKLTSRKFRRFNRCSKKTALHCQSALIHLARNTFGFTWFSISQTAQNTQANTNTCYEAECCCWWWAIHLNMCNRSLLLIQYCRLACARVCEMYCASASVANTTRSDCSHNFSSAGI